MNGKCGCNAKPGNALEWRLPGTVPAGGAAGVEVAGNPNRRCLTVVIVFADAATVVAPSYVGPIEQGQVVPVCALTADHPSAVLTYNEYGDAIYRPWGVVLAATVSTAHFTEVVSHVLPK